ncbi:hypothetical protein BDQ17DRAFT_1334683 [Cyathus striatus]|nr:hypothetical protein BDQ17DRAFT_1334683 [Cyathus striatus]
MQSARVQSALTISSGLIPTFELVRSAPTSSRQKCSSVQSSSVPLRDTTLTWFSQFVRPSHLIIEYIFRTEPNSVIAVAHDDDWKQLLNEDENDVPDLTGIVQRIEQAYSVCVDNRGTYLEPKEPHNLSAPSRKQPRGGHKMMELNNLAQKLGISVLYEATEIQTPPSPMWSAVCKVNGEVFVGKGPKQRDAVEQSAMKALEDLRYQYPGFH